MGRRPPHLEPQRQHPLGLDPDVQIGRLAGDREVADEPALDQSVAAASSPSSDSSSPTIPSRTRTRSWSRSAAVTTIIAAIAPFMS